jgi:hypothetical protein
MVARGSAAQQRLSRRFRVLSSRKNVVSMVAAAVARDLAEHQHMGRDGRIKGEGGLPRVNGHREVPCPPTGVKATPRDAATLRDAATMGAGCAVGLLRSPGPPGSVSSLGGP